MTTSTTSDPAITKTLTDLLSHLIRMPTVTADKATNRAALDWIEQQLQELPLVIKRYEHNGFPSLVATTTGAADPKNPKLWLMGHIDVVPGDPKTFQPRLHDGKLYGRGVHDMKFAIACFIALLQELGSSLSQYDLGLIITADEEYGGYDGAKWLVEHHGLRGGAVITPDSGGSWEMELGSKGVMWWELTASGRTAHASRTWEGDNAIEMLIAYVDHVKSHVPAEPCGDDNHQHATVNLASLHAGTDAANKVPDAATARVDVRFPPGISLETVSSWFHEAQAAMPHVTARAILADAPYQVKNNGPIHVFRSIVRDVTGHDVTPTSAHGSSDARHFAHHGISTINVVPTGSGFHMPDEWIDVTDLANFYEVIRRFTNEWSHRS